MISNFASLTNFPPRQKVSIPNGDKHDFKLADIISKKYKKSFQSPMGISMISNLAIVPETLSEEVSIPNGDKHDFKLCRDWQSRCRIKVSIPNGDKHDFKPGVEVGTETETAVSIPNGDKHDFKQRSRAT